MPSREPRVKLKKILDLRPGQIAVGYEEVRRRRADWGPKLAENRQRFLHEHYVPIIRGPRVRVGTEFKRIRLIHDLHHMTRGLFLEQLDEVLISVRFDYGNVSEDEFWYIVEARGLIHPFDENGRRQSHTALPATVADLKDDPYRSLAWAMRRLGGYSKVTDISFSEFLWADFLRRRIPLKNLKKDFKGATKEAYELARSKDANHLPGWCGPIDSWD